MNRYQKYIDQYIKEMRATLEEKLQFLLIIGSSCSSEVIDNWSDIDVIIVLDEYDFKTIEVIKNISYSYPVKIGTTIYTRREFENKSIDPKTIYHLYLYNKGEIDLQYKNDDIVIPKINYRDVYNSHMPYLFWRLHIYKRNFLYDHLTKEQIKGIFKTTYLIMKAILIIDGETPKNYREVFEGYAKKYSFPYYDFEQFICNYLDNNDQYTNIVEYGKEFLLNVIEKF